MQAQIDDDDDDGGHGNADDDGERVTEISPTDTGNSTSFQSLAISLSG